MAIARLLVRLPNWLGDIVMSLPALGAVRARWPDASLAVALPRAYAPLAEAMPGVDATVPLAIGRGWRDRATFDADVARVRDGRFDAVLLFTNSFASALMAQRAGIPERWGYHADLRGLLLTRGVSRSRRPRGPERHHSRYYARLVEALGCVVRDSPPRLSLPGAWRGRGDELLGRSGVALERPPIGIAPGAAYGAAKQWPPALVAEVIARAVRERQVTCVLLGSSGDAPAGAQLLQRLDARSGPDPARPRVVDLIGSTDLPTLAGVLARCSSLLCNDSGAMHLAAALGVHVVVPFGPTDEFATAPLGRHALLTGTAWCRPCLRRECPIDHRCMWTIDPGRVLEALW